MKIREIDYRKWAGAVVVFGGVFLFAVFFFRRLFAVLIPFLLAWGIAFLVRPAVYAIGRHTRIPRKIISVTLTVLAFFLIGGGVFLLCTRLWREIGTLLTRLSENPDTLTGIFERLRAFVDRLRAMLPFPRERSVDGGFALDEERISEMLTESVKGVVAFLSRAVGAFLLRLPSVFLFLLVTVIAAIYFALDLKGINRAVLSALPEGVRGSLVSLKRGLAKSAAVYIRSYTILFCLTFALLLVGFLILRLRYALILAFLFALVDLLPVIGVGSMLVPWGVFCLLTGKVPLGICLLALYLIIAVVRQIVEPRLLGVRLGLHPLLTLFSMYAGLILFGILGMILGPLIASLLGTVLKGTKSTANEA